MSEVERLNRMFGEGQWVCCGGCPGAKGQPYAVHHHKYHERK